MVRVYCADFVYFLIVILVPPVNFLHSSDLKMLKILQGNWKKLMRCHAIKIKITPRSLLTTLAFISDVHNWLGVLLSRLWDTAGVHPIELRTKKKESDPSKENSITTSTTKALTDVLGYESNHICFGKIHFVHVAGGQDNNPR